jgi:peptidoglycan/LPS O-acetylase OafA/YrhL
VSSKTVPEFTKPGRLPPGERQPYVTAAEPMIGYAPDMSAQSAGKIEELESIRGIAALLVVLFHIPVWNTRLHDIQFVQNGYYMVDLFFVLSGFVMNLNYGDRLHSLGDLTRFQFLRLGRLYPVHLLFLLLGILTSASSWIAVTAFGLNNAHGSAIKDATFASLAEQLLLIHSLGFFKIVHPFNLPSWSISVEFYTYLVFGIFCLISHYVLRLSTFVVLSGAALVLLSVGGEGIGNFSEILQCLGGYFLGCLVASFAARHPHALPRGSTFTALAVMTLFLCMRTDPHFDIAIFFLSALLIAAVVCSRDDFAKGILRHRSLKFLGLISYSIYMSHTFVLWVCNQFVRVVLRRPEAVVEGISTPQLSLFSAFLWHGIALAGTIIVSALVFKYVEDPFRLKSKEFARRFLTPRHGPVPVAVIQNRE